MRALLAAFLAVAFLSGAVPHALAVASEAPPSKTATKRLLRYIANYDTDAFLSASRSIRGGSARPC